MDNTGGCGPGNGKGKQLDLKRKQPDLVLSTNSNSSHTKNVLPSTFPLEKREQSKSSEKLLTAVNRWSQEENNAIIAGESSQVYKLSPSALPHLPLTNGITSSILPAVNGSHGTSSNNGVKDVEYKLTSGKPGEQSLLNNNLIEEKCNLRCVDEKSYGLYHKFPTKVNNNVYSEKGNKDGMDEYFQKNASSQIVNRQSSQVPPPHQEQTKRNELSPSRDVSKYPDHLNLLNGEDDDDDEGYIYTYKGENIEANLSHLIDMCLSCGLPNTERTIEGDQVGRNGLVSGSPRPDAPPEQNNLFSPEMDFLEMDFDPGPNGDEDLDSDCEDNCVDECDSRLVRENNDSISVAGALNPISVLHRKTNNYCSEMRNLMCKRCESSICDGKIDNVALNLSLHENNSSFNFGRGPIDGLDDRPIVKKDEVLNVPRDAINVPKDLNVDLNHFSATCSLVNGRSASLVPDEEYDPPDNDSVENNLGEADIMDMMDDEYGDDADDEDGDDSNSDMPDLHEKLSSACHGGSSDFVLREEQGSFQFNSNKSINKTSNKTNNKSNNNLGSISAPEVSPAKEYSPLEKFGRSISFHNQLSSPKYENVCFSTHRSPNGQEHHSCQAVPLRKNTVVTEAANLEICAGRLNSREHSVFNILSDPNTDSAQSVNVVLDNSSEGPDFNSTTNTKNTPHSLFMRASTSSVTATHVHLQNGSKSPTPHNMLTGLNGTPCPLPVKSLRPKNNNPSQDPNTASEGEGGEEESCPRVKKVMIWTELQATGRQVTQIATSACGATAIINVLLALDYPHTIEDVNKSIKTRLRAQSAPVVNYLLSRSVAGTTHKDLIEGVTSLSKGSIKAKFFHMFPKRAVQLSRWLAQWINKDGVPLATLNLQVGVGIGQTIPDAWHHQMIFGVGPQGIYLTNPLECVSDCLLGEQLCTDSVLLVRRADIVDRWGQGDKLIRLTQQDDSRWLEMNVLGQVLGVLKEEAAPPVMQGRRHLTSHVAIPAAYQSGITIFMRADNPHIHTLMEAEELPLLE